MPLSDTLRALLARWSQAWPDALASAVAAAVAWSLAQALFGHAQPVFASVAAVVCLAPGIPSRAGQAVNMMLGLVIGILVGETVLLVAPPAPAAALIALLVSLATMAAISFGLLPVIAIQGGVSALLVLALGPAAAGAPRFLDALVGTGVGLVFSQVLLTPDPARLVHAAAAQLLRSLADALARLADAVEKADAGGAVATRARLIEAREDVNLLQLRIATAASLERWSLRGRWRRRAAERAIERYADRGALLHAAALVLADAMAAQLQADAPPPRRLAARLRRDGAALDALQRGKPAPDRTQEDPEPSADAWRPCLESLEALERLVDALSSEPDLRA